MYISLQCKFYQDSVLRALYSDFAQHTMKEMYHVQCPFEVTVKQHINPGKRITCHGCVLSVINLLLLPT